MKIAIPKEIKKDLDAIFILLNSLPPVKKLMKDLADK